MQFVLRLFIFLCCASSALAAAKTQTRLILSAETVRAGETVWAGIELKMPLGWHTYWKNSGDSGSPTEINGLYLKEFRWGNSVATSPPRCDFCGRF